MSVAVVGQHQQQLLAHGLADLLEEGQGQGRDAAALVEGVAVEPVEGRPFGLGDLIAAARAGCGSRPPATRRRSRLTFLRFSAVKVAEEVVEGAVARVAPVELAADAGAAGPASSSRSVSSSVVKSQCRDETPSCSATWTAPSDQGRGRSRRVSGLVAGQEAWPGRRGVGRGHHQLGVVGEPVAPIGIRPGPVEDELPVGVELEVAGGGRDQESPAGDRAGPGAVGSSPAARRRSRDAPWRRGTRDAGRGRPGPPAGSSRAAGISSMASWVLRVYMGVGALDHDSADMRASGGELNRRPPGTGPGLGSGGALPADPPCPCPLSTLGGQGVQVLLRVQGGHAAGPGGGDGLAVDMVHDVAGGEDPGDRGGGGVAVGAALDLDVAAGHVELALEDLGVGLVADGDEDARAGR